MKYESFLIKYAEIGIKGKNRCVFEEALCNQIKLALKRCSGEFSVMRTSGRVFVDTRSDYDYDEVVEALKLVFGITGICPVVIREIMPLEQLKEEAAAFIRGAYDRHDQSFKVHCRRLIKSYPQDSLEINAELGGAILDAFPDMKVDVHDPEIMLHVELRERTYIYSQIIPGPGGLPVGVGGKAMLLLSGGIDSPVAGYMVSKRGVKLDAVYFNAPPYTSERAFQKVVDLASIVARYSGPIWLHNINFTQIQLYIYDKCPHDELTIIMRRFMMRIAEAIAKRTECLGLITGESIGQVASQTMASLVATNEVCELPVFRPVIAFDKEDIITISKKIGTYETSIQPYEDCCTIFVAKHPVTKPNVEVIRRHEHNLDEQIAEMVEKALQTDEILFVDRDGARVIKQADEPLKPGW